MTPPGSVPPGGDLDDQNHGEGHRDADRHYREGVRKTVEKTTEEERERRARNMTPEEREAGERAEEKGREHAKH
jgi:hypothetical protein